MIRQEKFGSTKIKNGITAPQGFLAAGAHIGIKKENKDLALLLSEVPANAAAVFTSNVVKAAPLLWNQSILELKPVMRGIVINSGNANACTGETGFVHAELMAKTFAKSFNIQPHEVLVASTGIIGVPLPINTVIGGIEEVSKILSSGEKSGHQAAEAIMTTDTCTKEFSIQTEIGGKPVTIAGMAKGSGMIHPNMATMLSFITTDANISPKLLQLALQESTSRTYNMISVDGNTSTNDMVIILANGLAENPLINKQDIYYKQFVDALDSVNNNLARAIVADGEGATKIIEVCIQGAKTTTDAQRLAKSVVSSNLVKTAFFAEDANWGRIICALGYAGVDFNPMDVSLELSSTGGCIDLMRHGEPIEFDEDQATAILKEHEIKVLVTIGEGKEIATAWGCDLTYDYVRINSQYRT